MLLYRERVIRIAHGEETPDRDICIEWMLSDTLQIIRDTDGVLAKDFIEGFCTLLGAQTAEERLTVAHLGPYLAAREVDVGRTSVYRSKNTKLNHKAKTRHQLLRRAHPIWCKASSQSGRTSADGCVGKLRIPIHGCAE